MTRILYLVVHTSFRKLHVCRFNFDHHTHINANDVIAKSGKMTFRKTSSFRTPNSVVVRNGLHDGKKDVCEGW